MLVQSCMNNFLPNCNEDQIIDGCYFEGHNSKFKCARHSMVTEGLCRVWPSDKVPHSSSRAHLTAR